MILHDILTKCEIRVICRRRFKRFSRKYFLVENDIGIIRITKFIMNIGKISFESTTDRYLESGTIFYCKNKKLYSKLKKNKLELFFSKVIHQTDHIENLGYRKFENKKAYMKWKLQT